MPSLFIGQSRSIPTSNPSLTTIPYSLSLTPAVWVLHSIHTSHLPLYYIRL